MGNADNFGKEHINFYMATLKDKTAAYGKVNNNIFHGFTVEGVDDFEQIFISTESDLLMSITQLQRLDHINHARAYVKSCERLQANKEKSKLSQLKIDAKNRNFDIDEETGDPLFI
ncbi:MAG: hypothetical protein FWC00_06330 [Firmicutes bacterium]|nr:hypothetical protein [Bacillota bacterium]